MIRKRINISGQVQGVGFRPAVYIIATKLDLTGIVFNNTSGVTIEIQGDERHIDKFIENLKGPDKPSLAEIENIETHTIDLVADESQFRIKQSNADGSVSSQVTPDIATCDKCFAELFDENDLRYEYPFINCTNCGPRYSIVKTIPYDRRKTTMADFNMCDKCSEQYTEITDRRFHAQPVACSQCGPEIALLDNKGKVIETQTNHAIRQTALMLKGGNIIAIKGLGGFHLAVNALDEKAVDQLRERKKRDSKPFALMSDSVEKIKKYAIVTEQQERLLKSPQCPIVLLKKKDDCGIADSAAHGLNTLGFMLCYTPLHWLLFAKGLDVLVMTSGNISDEPLICDNEKAIEKLGSVADYFLTHNRDIYRQVDDSIVQVVDKSPALLRRSRGYVPAPVLSETIAKADILAAGSDLKNTFCLAKGNRYIVSEHIGDLENADVYHHYIKSIDHLKQLFAVEPKLVVCDLHPGYNSTQFAESLGDIKILKVQHHWAHIASVMAENNIEGKVIGLSADGTGFGTDNAVWGCECLIASLDDFERFGHLNYFDLPGANLASKEAIRPLLGLLKKTFAEEFDVEKFGWLAEQIEGDIEKQRIIVEQLSKGLNTVTTSSLGRLFDAVSAMAGIGSRNNFEAELPMKLQAAIQGNIEEGYDFELSQEDGKWIVNTDAMVKQIIEDVQKKTEVGIIAAKFHNCVCEFLTGLAVKAREKTNINDVALSGGVFCNSYLAERCIKSLRKQGFSVLFNRQMPTNDACISLGQAAIAANLLQKGKV